MTAAAGPGAGPDRRGTGRTVAVVAGAGGGLPGGAGDHALLAPLAGRPLIEHSVAAFEAAPLVDEILVVVPPDLAGPVGRVLAAGRHRKVSAVIGGGATRPEILRRALAALGEAAGVLLTHDAGRPLVSQRVIEDCVTALGSYEAVCAAVPAADTMVRVEKDLISERPLRDRLRYRQTPQGFRLEVIRRACELALADPACAAADDCGIVLRYLPEVTVRLVRGSEQAFPVTRPRDLAVAESLLRAGLPA